MCLRWLPVIGLALLLSGCGQKSAPPAPPTTATAQMETSALAPAQPTAAQAQPIVVAEGGDTAAVLSSLTQALRKYSAEHRRVPKSFSEVIAAGYVKNLPPAPPGKQYGVDPKTVSVVLLPP